jgi:fucose permease
MTALIGAGLSWRWGYAAVAVLQVGLVLGFFVTRAHWPVVEPPPAGGTRLARRRAAGPRPAAAWLGPLVFFAYGAVEVAVGAWVFVLLTGRGLGDTAAGASVTAYWGALALGRLGLGALGPRVTSRQIVAVSVVGVVVGAVGLWVLPSAGAPVALVVMGLSLAGIFPALTALTPSRVGADRATPVIGRQLAAAVVGGAAGSAVVGVVAQRHGSDAVAPALLVISVLLLATDAALSFSARDVDTRVNMI